MTQNSKTRAIVASIPESTWDEIRSLHDQVTQARGWKPLDDDSRIAGDAFYDIVADTHERYGISLWSMAINLGLNGRTIKHWMFSHGYVYNGSVKPPSLATYRGVMLNNHRDACKRGHDLNDPANLYSGTLHNGKKWRTCKICMSMRKRGVAA